MGRGVPEAPGNPLEPMIARKAAPASGRLLSHERPKGMMYLFTLRGQRGDQLIVNPKVCGFPEACFGVSKRLQNSSSLGMEDASQLAARLFTFAPFVRCAAPVQNKL